MLPIQQFTPAVLAEILRRQPDSPGRTAFAWQLAVGPAVARATSVELAGGTLTVRAADARWLREVARSSDVVLTRLQNLLGKEAVVRIKT